jgi:hypothetical protein
MDKAKKAEKTGKTKKAPEAKQEGQETAAQAPAKAPEKEPESRFAHADIFSKPSDLSKLFGGFRQAEISAEILRPRLQTESVEHGRGQGIIKGFVFRKFNEEPRAVLFMIVPRSTGGGIFEPADRLLNPGEPVRINYNMMMDGADRPVFFLAKGFFLRKGFFIPEDPQNPGKSWVGPRDDAAQRFSKDAMVAGDDVIELRVDTVNSFPHGPGKVYRDVLERYLSAAKLYILPTAGGWNQKSNQGNFFDRVKDPLDKYIAREGVKIIEQVVLDEFANMGDITVMVKESLLANMEHDVARPMVIKNPNDYLGEINAKLGFLLSFKVTPELGEALIRVFPSKAGKDDEVYLPVILDRVNPAKERYRVDFRLFPRDLVEERSHKTMDRGLKFMPPYTLHPGAENHNTYSKLLIILSQRFREDERPEEEKVKSGKLKASVDQRIAEQRHKFVDDKVKAAFQDRVTAAKRKDEGA